MTAVLHASFANALAAAREAAGSQHYPQGTLYVVATPIGNLADITLRALHVLQIADLVACEDTRHTQGMLRAYGIDKSAAQLLAVHQHNELEAAQRVVARLAAGERIAYVSDAGTPAVSDPGAKLVDVAREAGFRVMPLPGASSITTALSAAGLTQDTGFVFEGFLSSRATEREAQVLRLQGELRAAVLLEAPHRIEALAAALSALGARRVTVGRELTKQFETVATMAAEALPGWLAADAQRTRGEFVVVLHAGVVQEAGAGRGEEVLRLLLAEGLPVKGAVKIAAQLTGEPRNGLYEQALLLRDAEKGDESGSA